MSLLETETRLSGAQDTETLVKPGKFWSVHTLLETADIGGAAIADRICRADTRTNKALKELGVTRIRLAGSITLGSGNFYCSIFDSFSRIIADANSGELVRVTEPTGDPDIDTSWHLTRMLDNLNLPEEAHEAKSIEQLLDFLTGRNADFLLTLDKAPDEQAIEAIYEALVGNIPLDLDQGKYIISLTRHADRLPIIQISDTQNKYNQGINLIFETSSDDWNKSTTGRIKEVVDLDYLGNNPGIYISREPIVIPSALTRTPSSIGEFLAIFSQELRRTILYPDRGGINLTSYQEKLLEITNPAISHEQVCLITANLARSLAINPKSVDETLKHLQINKYFTQNTVEEVRLYLTKAINQIFTNRKTVNPDLIKYITTALPMKVEDFAKLNPTRHPVLKSQVLNLSQFYY